MNRLNVDLSRDSARRAGYSSPEYVQNTSTNRERTKIACVEQSSGGQAQEEQEEELQ